MAVSANNNKIRISFCSDLIQNIWCLLCCVLKVDESFPSVTGFVFVFFSYFLHPGNTLPPSDPARTLSDPVNKVHSVALLKHLSPVMWNPAHVQSSSSTCKCKQWIETWGNCILQQLVCMFIICSRCSADFIAFTFASTLVNPESYCSIRKYWDFLNGNVLLDNPKKAICMWDQKSLSLLNKFTHHDYKNIAKFWCN